MIGTSYPRPDLSDVLACRPHFIDDLKWDHECWGGYIRATQIGAEVEGYSFCDCPSPRGVIAVFGPDDVPDAVFNSAAAPPAPEVEDTADQQLLARVPRHVGDPVLFVVAESREELAAAIRSVELKYGARSDALPLSRAVLGSACFGEEHEPDPPRLRTYELKTSTQPVQHVCLDTHGAVAIPAPDKSGVTIYTNSQAPAEVRYRVAAILQLEPGQVRVVKVPEGGGFGNKQEIYSEIILACAALKLGRVVRCKFDRVDEFLGTRYRHPTELSVSARTDIHGTVRSFRLEGQVTSGAYVSHTLHVMGDIGSYITRTYDGIANSGELDALYLAQPSSGAYRGYGAPQAAFAFEQLIDSIASTEKIDPLEFRIRFMETAGPAGEDTLACLRAARPAWQRFLERHDRDKAREGRELTGVGLAFTGMSNTTVVGRPEGSSAMVALGEMGRVVLSHGTVDSGTGSSTGILQIFSAATGIDPGVVHVLEGDTSSGVVDLGSYAQRSIYVGGAAVQDAARSFLRLIKDAASEVLQRDPQCLEVIGRAVCDARSKKELISLRELATWAVVNGRRLAALSLAHPARPRRSYCVAMAEVCVDAVTLRERATRICLQLECGRVINPALVRGQLAGAAAQAIGWTFFEDARNTVTGDYVTKIDEHRLPTLDDVPTEFEVFFLEGRDGELGPFGARGVGEVGIPPVPAALANALADATGRRFTHLPIRMQDLYEAVASGTAR